MRYPLYFKALSNRSEKPNNEFEKQLIHVKHHFEKHSLNLPKNKQGSPKHIEYFYMIEELQVSFYGQKLGTITPISMKRLQKYWENI